MSDEKRALGAAGGALGLGGFAAVVATCCGVPWAVTLLGVTGAVALARLAFLLPYAIGGAILLLATAFWLAYRQPRTCTDATTATASRGSLQWIVWIAALLVATMSIFALIPLVGI